MVCRVAVILCEFQDVKMMSGTKERMEDLFFSTDKLSTGSVTEYYKEVSNGKVAFTGEVFGPYTMSQTMSYYANNGKISLHYLLVSITKNSQNLDGTSRVLMYVIWPAKP